MLWQENLNSQWFDMAGGQEGHLAFKVLGVGGDILTGVLHILQFQLLPLTTSITLSRSNIQNGDIPVPANLGAPGK